MMRFGRFQWVVTIIVWPKTGTAVCMQLCMLFMQGRIMASKHDPYQVDG